MPLDFKKTIKDTLDLRMLLLESLSDLVMKRITPTEARARSWLAKTIVDTLRVEMIAAREGKLHYEPVLIDSSNVIEEKATEETVVGQKKKEKEPAE